MSEVSSSCENVLAYSAKQKAVLSIALRPETKFLLLDGSVGAGKTSLLAMAWALWVKSGRAAPGGATIFMGKTLDTIHRNIVAAFKNVDVFGELALELRIPQGATSFKLFGEQVVCVSGNDPRASQKLQGVNAKAIIIDELATLDEEFFEQALKRLRVGDEKKLYASFNPRHPKHWLKTKYIDRIGTAAEPGVLFEHGWRHIVMWMNDNPGLPEDYKNNLRASLQGKDYLRDVCGQWVAEAGRVYDNFDERVHVVKFEELPHIARILAIGLDYGDTAASAAVVVGVDADFKRLYVIDEFGYEAGDQERQLAPVELARRVAEWIEGLELPNQVGLPFVDAVLVDPGGGGTGLLNQLRDDPVIARLGLRNRLGAAPKAAGSVLDGVRLIRSLFALQQLVVTDRCSGLIGEFDVYSYDSEASERRGEQVIKKGNDHYCDALRYAVYSSRGVWRRWIVTPEHIAP